MTSKALAGYSVLETLRSGSVVEIRATRPEDKDEMLKGVERSSDDSLYKRFMAPKRTFSEKEIEYLMEIDFVKHVALVAVLQDAGRPIIAGGRYVSDGPGTAELAFVVEDAHQGQGIGALLLRHLIGIARGAGLRELHAEVLPENASMIKVFERCGLTVSQTRDPWTVQITLSLG